jgi:large subunit ribosomal protein L18
MEKKLTRKRRSLRARMKMRELGVTRLCVYRSLKHIYAQLIATDGVVGDKILASASTLDAEVKAQGATLGNVKASSIIGAVIAKRAIAAGINRVAFDRSGYKYHGCIKALADAAREGGLQF